MMIAVFNLFRFARRRKAVLSALAISLAMTIMSSLGAAPASAAGGIGNCVNQPSTGHCYSASVIELYGNSLYDGAHIAMALLPMATASANAGNGYHVNNTLWVVMGKDWSDNYIEAGLADGWAYPNGYTSGCQSGDKFCTRWSYASGNGGSSTCYYSGCGAYFLYWEDHNVSGGVKYSYMHVVRFTSPTPSVTQYIDIIHNYDGSGNWNINFSGYYTYNAVSSIDDSYQHPYQIQAGGEVYAPQGAAACATTTTDTVGEWFDGLNITFLNTDVSPVVTPGVGLTGRGSEDLSGWWTWSLDSPC